MKKALCTLPLVLLPLFGCTTTDKDTEVAAMTQDSAPAVFKDIRWELVELMGQPVKYASTDSQKVYLQFNSGDSRVNGNDGCNAFTGAFEDKAGQRLYISKLASTKKFCPHMPTEENFTEILQSIDTYTVSDGMLVLTKARMAPLARFKAVEL